MLREPIVCAVNQRLVLLNLLRRPGLSEKAREVVLQALIVWRALVTPCVFLLACCLVCISRVSMLFVYRERVKLGLIDRMCDTETLNSDAEVRLFRRFKDNSEHC
jgi:hypothetical protein